MNPTSTFNRDIKLQSLATDSRPKSKRFGYFLLAGLSSLFVIALLSGNPKQASALQSISEAPANSETSSDTITEILALPSPAAGSTSTDNLVSSLTPAAIEPSIEQHQPTTQTEPEGHWQQVTIKSGDSLATIFNKLHISPQQLHALLKQGGAAHNLKKIYPGQTLRLMTNEQHDLVKLSYPIDKLSSLEVSRNGKGFDISTTHRTPEHQTVSSSATIKSSLFLAANKAGLSDKVTMELAGIFGWDIDFALDIRKGDQFTVIYEEIYLDGEHIGNGDILAAEFINQGKRYRAIRYTDAGGRTDYYALNGESMRKTFLRTPVEFSRISSRFSSGRKHPILNKIRAHKGVDYAASRGTPIKSTANGKIIHIGKKGGYGNTIIVQHGTRYSTLYAHMSKYRGGLKKGSRVRQGQTIGYIGSTGLATGPHLHYELRVDGTHRNPLRVKLPGADPLNKKYMADFTSQATTLTAQIDLIRDVQVASTQ